MSLALIFYVDDCKDIILDELYYYPELYNITNYIPFINNIISCYIEYFIPYSEIKLLINNNIKHSSDLYKYYNLDNHTLYNINPSQVKQIYDYMNNIIIGKFLYLYPKYKILDDIINIKLNDYINFFNKYMIRIYPNKNDRGHPAGATCETKSRPYKNINRKPYYIINISNDIISIIKLYLINLIKLDYKN
tara:strand:- start:11733 stop:12305 length:573 start_codon:yes stop_codon:yes gene_type:complete